VKNALSFWQVHASGSEEIDIEKKKTIPDGGRTSCGKPCFGRKREKGYKARKARNPMLNRG
jgi:hypothetical protein